MRQGRVDGVAVVAAAIALAMTALYLGIMRSEGDSPVAWFLVALVGGALAAAYGADRRSPRRPTVLFLGGLVLSVIGLLGVFSIGLPILVAGVLTVTAGVRSLRQEPDDASP